MKSLIFFARHMLDFIWIYSRQRLFEYDILSYFVKIRKTTGVPMMEAFTFFDFVLKPEELSLYHKDNRMELGLKGFKLLIKLVENQGKLIPKDELIAAAWENQIVTDGTLSKQIERIRQTLAEFYPEETFIETVRGIGYTFIPKIKSYRHKKKGLKKWQKAIFSVSILPLVLLLYFYLFEVSNQNENPFENTIPFNIAVIPSANGADYINQGGISFLSELLLKNPRIYGVSSKASWFLDEDKRKLAIELEDQKNLDFVLMVDLQEKDTRKTATLELKNNNQYIKQATLNSNSFKQLFADINSWVLMQLEIEDRSHNSFAENNLSSDSFAVESFLRGKKESSSRNYAKAIQYFRAAIAQDPDFTLAMLEMAYAQIKSNDYAAAEALLQTIEAGRHLNDDLKLSLLINKASLLTNTLRSSEVRPFIDETLMLAEKSGDKRKLIFALYYQGEMYKETGDIEKSIESTLRQKEVLQLNSKDMGDLMRVANNLSHAYYEINQFEQAREQILPAIGYFEETKHIVGMLNSYGLLASIYYELANYEKGLIVINKALALKDKVEDKHLRLYILEVAGYLQMAAGLHDDCRQSIREMEALTTEMGMDYPLYLARIMSLALEIATKNHTTLKEDTLALDEMTSPLKEDFLFVRQVALSHIIQANIILENHQMAESRLQELKEITKNDLTQGDMFYQFAQQQLKMKTGSSDMAHKKLKNLLTKMIGNNRYKQAHDIAFFLADYYVGNNDYKRLESLLNQIDHTNPFPYPYLKYKAKLAFYKMDYFNASRFMNQMKNTSHQWWTTENQLFLDEIQSKLMGGKE